MKSQLSLCLLIAATISSSSSAQLATSHAPSMGMGQSTSAMTVVGKPVVKVNGAVLTDRDLLREMYAMFPYARQHNGFPKEMEGDIRKGAMKMMVFEELAYQEAKRKQMTVTPVRMQKAQVALSKQFSGPAEYRAYLRSEFNGSEQEMREKIKRSLLIESFLKVEVDQKAIVSPAEVKAYYDQNSALFLLPESFAFQSISILPPQGAAPAILAEARKRAESALKQAKASKTYEEFGMLAEKTSDDDYRVMMGDHKTVPRAKLPPNVLNALLTLKPGQVTDLLQIDNAYTILRMNQHTMAGKAKFEDVKASLKKQLGQKKTEQLRSTLDKRLRQNAKVETL